MFLLNAISALAALLWLSASPAVVAQSNGTQPSSKNGTSPSSLKWIENKVVVRADPPYLSDSKNLVLAYTITNKSGQDIQLSFGENPVTRLEQRQPMRVFLKLKNADSYSQVSPEDHFLYLRDTLLVADLPISFHIVVSGTSDDKSSWFSSESADDHLRRLLQEKLGNAQNITILIPDRHLKITLPIPSRSRSYRN